MSTGWRHAFTEPGRVFNLTARYSSSEGDNENRTTYVYRTPIDGRIEEGVFRSDKGLVLPLPASADIASLGGRQLVYGIRPEHIRVMTGGIEGRVSLVEGTGSEIFARLDCQGEDVACLFRERLDVRFGDTMHIAVDPSSAHLFDKQTGKRI